MSLARTRFALRAAPRIHALPRSTAVQSSLIAYRLLSSTARRSHAEPVNIKHQDQFPGHRLDPPGLRSPEGTANYTAQDEPGKQVDPYKGGQSAIDKAVHLFFFTEIIRGAKVSFNGVSETEKGFQECG